MLDFFAFIRAKFAEYSQFAGQMGTPIDDLAVKPTGLVMSNFYNSLVDQQLANDITNWQNMSDAQMDFFGNKFFMPRALGDFAFGFVRIYFAKRADIEISNSFLAISTTSLQFSPIQVGYFSKNSMRVSRDATAPFYIDIQVIATSPGSAYNLDPNTITQLSGINFDYITVTNPNEFKSGLNRENNSDYYKRLLYSVNDRSLMNQRSFIARVSQIFPSVTSIYIAGAGNPYMQRDLVAARDLSQAVQLADYFGKIAGNSTIPSVAFEGMFPPEPGNVHAQPWGPHSIISQYDNYLTIDPAKTLLNPTIDDVALFGYPIDQEFTNPMYQGVYFNDLSNVFSLSTQDLFNIALNNTSISPTPVAVPNASWIYGANGYPSGNYGQLASSDISGTDVINFLQNTINLSGGAVNPLSVGIDIQKRTGVKVTGSFTWPNVIDKTSLTANSNLQIMVGGYPSQNVDAFSGIGFGIRVIDGYTAYDGSNPIGNALIFFAHSENYSQAQVFATQNDISSNGIGISDIGALNETSFRIEPGKTYDFEFVLHDDLSLTLFLKKVVPNSNLPATDEHENVLHYSLAAKALKAFSSQILAVDSDWYGTILKATLETASASKTDTWSISDLKAFDTAEHRASALFALDVSKISAPGQITLRAFGSGAVAGAQYDGYRAYIWDTQAPNAVSESSELTAGAWSELSGLTDPDGSKLSLQEILTQTINGFDRYSVQSRYGTNIFILITPAGPSRASSQFSGETIDDIPSSVIVDYISMTSANVDSYHANNKADAYVVTYKNSEALTASTVTIQKDPTASFFVLDSSNCTMPIADILSVTLGNSTTPLSNSDYVVIRPDLLLQYSSKETVQIALVGQTSNQITVEYDSYPNVADMQSYFDTSSASKIYGDTLIRHKLPCTLNITLYFTGSASNDSLISAIRQYVDDNNADLFVVQDFISYLYNGNFVNNIQTPITIEYSKFDDDMNIVSGSFTDSLSIREIDFFRIGSLAVNRL